MDYLSKIGESIIRRNRMRESRSYGSVGERGGNEPLYPEYRTSEVGDRMICRIFFKHGDMKGTEIHRVFFITHSP